ncbi:MAG: hypothetical protein ABSE86_37455 [Bryobacteraceae bacterium]
MRPNQIQLSFKEAGDRDAALAAISELNTSLQELGADVQILLQESGELPPLVLYVGVPSMLLARAIAQALIAWINRNRVTIKSTKIDGTEVSIEGSEAFVRDLLVRKSKD